MKTQAVIKNMLKHMEDGQCTGREELQAEAIKMLKWVLEPPVLKAEDAAMPGFGEKPLDEVIADWSKTALRVYLADATALVWGMQHRLSEGMGPLEARPPIYNTIAEHAELLVDVASIIAGIVARWELVAKKP